MCLDCSTAKAVVRALVERGSYQAGRGHERPVIAPNTQRTHRQSHPG